MTALAHTAAPAHDPDPHQDQAQSDAPARTTRLRGVLGKLIAHGKRLAEDLTRRPSATTVFWIAVRFGTRDVALILARITRALQIAAALRATLPDDHPPSTERPVRAAPATRTPRTRSKSPPRKNTPSVLALLPPSADIAALLRQQPIGDVLTEICIGLGILPADPIWQELRAALVEHGADPDRVVQDADTRISVWETLATEAPSSPPILPRPAPPRPASCKAAPCGADPAPVGTGPP